jgi:RNA polymerase sigma-70 factor, ECF subfamily
MTGRPHRLDPDHAVEHLPRLYRAARAWVRSREEAEDLVQETYARVLARPRFLRGEEELGYLLRALRNTLVSQRRASSRRPRTVELAEDEVVAGHSGPDPADAAEPARSTRRSTSFPTSSGTLSSRWTSPGSPTGRLLGRWASPKAL